MSKKFYRAERDFVYGQGKYTTGKLYYLHPTAVETIARIYGASALSEQTQATAGEPAQQIKTDIVYDAMLVREVSQALADGASAAEYKELYSKVLALGGKDDAPFKKVKENKEALKSWISEIQDDFVDK